MDTKEFWTERYKANNTGWDVGYATTPFVQFIGSLENKQLKILIPGSGNAYEAEYLWKLGFSNVHVLDISPIPLANFKKKNLGFPDSQLVCGNFFKHTGQYDLILEQTFFCSFPPTKENRQHYAEKMHDLLKPAGKLVGLFFNFPLTENGPPYGGNKAEYLTYFEPLFSEVAFANCKNSIPPRAGKELWAMLKK